MDPLNSVPDGWYVADTSPSGVNRLLPADYQPVSLPHTRNYTAAKFSAGFWMCAGLVMAIGAVAMLVRGLL